MIILPAIDIRNSKVVRLTKGDYSQTTVYADFPSEIAKSFYEAGCQSLHIVDLDGAKDGELSNFEAIREILSCVKMDVQVGGGIRDISRIEKYLDLGVSRCIIGTAAITKPELLTEAVRQFGEKIAVGVDTNNGKVAVSGWLETTETDGVDFCKKLRDGGVKTVIYTDISKDGMLSGPNHEIYSVLSEIEGLNIVASGGVTTLGDVKRLKKTGVWGCIIGKALYTGKINLKEAMEEAICS